ncbi:MAG: hypothetical protein WD207_06365, partial [Xanthobacteraceae bacterium]
SPQKHASRPRSGRAATRHAISDIPNLSSKFSGLRTAIAEYQGQALNQAYFAPIYHASSFRPNDLALRGAIHAMLKDLLQNIDGKLRLRASATYLTHARRKGSR